MGERGEHDVVAPFKEVAGHVADVVENLAAEAKIHQSAAQARGAGGGGGFDDLGADEGHIEEKSGFQAMDGPQDFLRRRTEGDAAFLGGLLGGAGQEAA